MNAERLAVLAARIAAFNPVRNDGGVRIDPMVEVCLLAQGLPDHLWMATLAVYMLDASAERQAAHHLAAATADKFTMDIMRANTGPIYAVARAAFDDVKKGVLCKTCNGLGKYTDSNGTNHQCHACGATGYRRHDAQALAHEYGINDWPVKQHHYALGVLTDWLGAALAHMDRKQGKFED